MQRSFRLLEIGAGLAVLSSAAFCFHSHSFRSHFTSRAPVTAKTIRADSSVIAEAYGHLPLSFESNQGQVDKQVGFLSRGPGYNLFLTANEAVLALHTSGIGKSLKAGVRGSGFGVRGHSATRSLHSYQSTGIVNDPQRHFPDPDPRTPIPDVVLRLKLLGTNAHPQVTGLDPLPGNTNYFIGKDPEKWHTHIPTYGRVAYKQVYPGIDMVYYGNQHQLEYDWVVAPGAEVHQIQLAVKGAEKATLTAQGDLLLHTENGEVTQHAPVAYQEFEGTRKSVASHLALLASPSGTTESRIGFEVGKYDHTRPLVIDPVLVYSTYLGGGNDDQGKGIAVDSVGNAYVTGYTASAVFPIEAPFQSTKHSASGNNVFISVLNASGTALIYSTYLGGSGNDEGNGIVVDSSGNAYVTGSTSSTDFPTQNPLQPANHSTELSGSGSNAFITKINSTGSALIYSTYLGGSDVDAGNGIAIDSSGNAYVTGVTSSLDFPAQNPLEFMITGAFVTKINATGSALVYSTYLGGNGANVGNGIAVDRSGDAYVTGYTTASDFPTQNPTQETNRESPGTSTVFITKLNASANALVYSTYLGGSNGTEEGTGIAVDSSGNAYVTGWTSATNFPSYKAFQSTNKTNGSYYTTFVTKFNATGSAYVYSTYLGGSSGDSQATGIAADPLGNAYVTGWTTATDFPLLNPIQSSKISNYTESFVTEINATGSAPDYSTYLGATNGVSESNGIAVDSSGNAYITGYTNSSFVLQNPLQATNINETAGFVARIGNYNWQTVDATVGTDGLTRLLWTNTTQSARIWSVNGYGQVSNANSFGPFTGYTVQATAAGPDGLTRILWNKTDGTAALWIMNPNNTLKSSFNLGPFSGWTIADMAVGADNKLRLLWTQSDGSAGIWTVDNNGNTSHLFTYGPYSEWTASRIATGPDGYTRLLWTRTDGAISLWILMTDNTNNYNSRFEFGPYTSWRGIDIAVGADNKTRVLWTKSDGTAAVWTVDVNDNLTNMTSYGPYSGWTPTKITAGSDGFSRLVWFNSNGTQALWFLNGNNSFYTGANFGPN